MTKEEKAELDRLALECMFAMVADIRASQEEIEKEERRYKIKIFKIILFSVIASAVLLAPLLAALVYLSS